MDKFAKRKGGIEGIIAEIKQQTLATKIDVKTNFK